MTGRLVREPGELPGKAPALPARERILLAEPTHFDVTRADNPHTVDEQGHLHHVDRARARQQWDAMRRAFEEHGFEGTVLEAREGLPDLVFCCNTAWPYLDEATGAKRFVPSRMRYEGRRGEVPAMAQALERLGYEPTPLPEGAGIFEAGGDLQWLAGTRVLLAATGPRTDRKALEAASRIVEAPVVELALTDPDFYHLDTCLAVLSPEHIGYVPAAFDERSLALLEALDPALVEVPEDEARSTFAANLHCPDGETVFLDEANEQTTAILREHGYDVVGLDTSEFRKAGGSVFCMTNQVW